MSSNAERSEAAKNFHYHGLVFGLLQQNLRGLLIIVLSNWDSNFEVGIQDSLFIKGGIQDSNLNPRKMTGIQDSNLVFKGPTYNAPSLSGKGTVARLKSCLLSVNAWLSCPACQMAMFIDIARDVLIELAHCLDIVN